VPSERQTCNLIRYFNGERKEIKARRDKGNEERARKNKVLKKRFPVAF
jgi:hypothetical protein